MNNGKSTKELYEGNIGNSAFTKTKDKGLISDTRAELPGFERNTKGEEKLMAKRLKARRKGT